MFRADKTLRSYKSKAGEYLKDKNKAEELLLDAARKANKKSSLLEAVWEDLQLLFALLKDWKDGKYKKVPAKSILLVIASLLYFLNPLDMLPDFIPFGGLIDDAGILAFVVRQIHNDLQEYKTWLISNETNEKISKEANQF